MLGNGAGKQLKEIENSLIEAIKGSTNDDGYLRLSVISSAI
jgi:hypothetical protein